MRYNHMFSTFILHKIKWNNKCSGCDQVENTIHFSFGFKHDWMHSENSIVKILATIRINLSAALSSSTTAFGFEFTEEKRYIFLSPRWTLFPRGFDAIQVCILGSLFFSSPLPFPNEDDVKCINIEWSWCGSRQVNSFVTFLDFLLLSFDFVPCTVDVHCMPI